MRRIVPLLASLALLPLASPALAATCRGETPCRACKTCEHCAHCARRGGTCGVCAGTSSGRTGASAARRTARPASLRAAPSGRVSELSGGKLHTPEPGTKERKAILEALRVPVEKEARQKVVFHEVGIKVAGDWAYVIAAGRDSEGRRLKRWAREVDPAFQALLRKRGARWRVLSWGAGTGMAPTEEARAEYPQAPRSIFP